MLLQRFLEYPLRIRLLGEYLGGFHLRLLYNGGDISVLRVLLYIVLVLAMVGRLGTFHNRVLDICLHLVS